MPACVQWAVDTVHQRDYPCLLNATEVGQRLTYDSSNIGQLAKEFSHCASVAVTEVSVQLENSCSFRLSAVLCLSAVGSKPEAPRRWCEAAYCGAAFLNTRAGYVWCECVEITFDLCCHSWINHLSLVLTTIKCVLLTFMYTIVYYVLRAC